MKRVLSIQDLSCLGQCSLGVALPVLSACGAECAVLPTALLSTHTGSEFTPPVIRSLADTLPGVTGHWREMGITFDAVEIGYLGTQGLIQAVAEALPGLCRADTLVVLDPVMADHGKFYAGFDEAYARSMEALIRRCDLLLPNLTEACLLLGRAPEPPDCPVETCLELCKDLTGLGAKTVVLTGLSLRPHQVTNLVYTADGRHALLNHIRLKGSYHGTGDLFASACLGSILRGDTVTEAVRRAGRFVSAAIANTPQEKRYGTCFEQCLHHLCSE